MTEAVRLAKRLAQMLGCSRREAEQYIAGGFVQVDGEVVEEPQFRVLDQTIVLSPDASLLALTPVTLLLHKPVGVEGGLGGEPGVAMALQFFTAASLAPGDRFGLKPLKKHFADLTLAAPLAASASGLLVFTQDWRVTRKLQEDARVMEHEVVVEVSGTMSPGAMERLNRADHGFTFKGVALPPTKVSWQSETRLRFALKGEVPGQIAYLCESAGLVVKGMKRIRIGAVPLGQLQSGQWRYLLPTERF